MSKKEEIFFIDIHFNEFDWESDYPAGGTKNGSGYGMLYGDGDGDGEIFVETDLGCGLFYGNSEGNSSECIADYVVGRVTIPTLE
jgi:hypothetical protein